MVLHPPDILPAKPTDRGRCNCADRTDPWDPADRCDKEKLALMRDEFLCGNAERATPVPIPNTEVKPLWADGTAWVTVWESRSPQGI